MLNSGEIFTPMTEFYETETARQAGNKLKPINVGNRNVVPSIRTGENIMTGPGKLKTAAKLTATSNNTKFTIYQVRITRLGINLFSPRPLFEIKLYIPLCILYMWFFFF